MEAAFCSPGSGTLAGVGEKTNAGSQPCPRYSPLAASVTLFEGMPVDVLAATTARWTPAFWAIRDQRGALRAVGPRCGTDQLLTGRRLQPPLLSKGRSQGARWCRRLERCPPQQAASVALMASSRPASCPFISVSVQRPTFTTATPRRAWPAFPELLFVVGGVRFRRSACGSARPGACGPLRCHSARIGGVSL